MDIHAEDGIGAPGSVQKLQGVHHQLHVPDLPVDGLDAGDELAVEVAVVEAPADVRIHPAHGPEGDGIVLHAVDLFQLHGPAFYRAAHPLHEVVHLAVPEGLGHSGRGGGEVEMEAVGEQRLIFLQPKGGGDEFCGGRSVFFSDFHGMIFPFSVSPERTHSAVWTDTGCGGIPRW